MIPNALASSGPYADWWGHLRSIDHAISRVLDSSRSTPLAHLDRDRLSALLSLLKDTLSFSEKSSANADGFDFDAESGLSDFSSTTDIRGVIMLNQEFLKWEKPAKKSFTDDLQRLYNSVDRFLSDSQDAFVAKQPPRAEFEVLQSIIRDLLSDAEIALRL